jgi:hypothetical protein
MVFGLLSGLASLREKFTLSRRDAKEEKQPLVLNHWLLALKTDN